MEETLNRKDRIIMKLLHYFITERNYNPILLQGVDNEIWLENMDDQYKIIRIVSNHIHNDEQLNFDSFKTSRIVRKIKKKTFSFKMNVLSIYIDLGDNAHLENVKNMDCMYLYDEQDIKNYSFIDQVFPDIKNKLKFTEKGLQLFIKITNDINSKNKTEAEKMEEVFKRKKPIITTILIIINLLIFFGGHILGIYEEVLNKYCVYGPFIRNYHEYYRLFTGMFLHLDFAHILCNCYSLYIIGSQLEGFLGKKKYLAIYLFSGFIGSLASITFSEYASAGASGAIFGLLGSMLYFGYHYRVYLGNAMKSQIIPLLILNLVIGFMVPGIDYFAHIGGLIGGALATIALGVKYKSTQFEKINGWIVAILFTLFMVYMGILLPR